MKEIDYQTRRELLSKNLRNAGIRAYLVTRQAGLHYLCGVFMPWRGVALITDKNDFCLFYWANDVNRVRSEGATMDIVEYFFDDLFEKVFSRLKEYGIGKGRIALDLSLKGNAQPAPGILTASEYLELMKYSEYEFENGVQYLDDLLIIKGEEELERMRHVCHIADHGFNVMLSEIRPGLTENQVAGIIEKAIRDKGSYWAWSVTAGTEVGSGPRTAFYKGVTQISTDRRLQLNEFVIADFHPSWNLYLCDFSIPVFLGKPNMEQRKLIDCWEEVVDTVFCAIHPGVRICDVVKKGMNVYEKYGLSEYSLPRFGHGIGVCARTGPTLNLDNKNVFRMGMTFAMGAHLYVPGVGGLRLEYPVAVGEENAIKLPETPMKVHIVDCF